MSFRSAGAPRARLIAAWVDKECVSLDPSCFALVMATGVISNGFLLEGHRHLSDALFDLGVATYIALLLMFAWRMIGSPRALLSDLVDPRLVFSFFTIVAGADVLGVGMTARGDTTAAVYLWLFALTASLCLTYLGFGVLSLRNSQQGTDIVHGGWLIGIVGTQSVAILGARLAPAMGGLERDVVVLAHALWSIGIVLYLMFVTLFAQRLFISAVQPRDVTPLSWVVMGAAAISANAGSTLILNPGSVAFLRSLQPFTAGVTLTLWAWATWWIPLLLLLGMWKHVFRRERVVYTPLYWSLVFPIGMYAVASVQLSRAAHVALLQVTSQAMLWIGLAAWGGTGFALVLSLGRSLQGLLRSPCARTATSPW
jgi:tellurite resistance protein TehA-like permease